MPANGKPNGRFELPQLTPVTFSLTDGTDIPPPPESPIEEKAPVPAPKPAAVETPGVPHTGQTRVPSKVNGVYDGRGRTTDQPPLSPASTTRPSSIRRFLSRKSLNTNYTNGTNHNGSQEDLTGFGRPDSPSSFMTGPPGLKQKKSGSWFRRLGSSGGGNRTSVVYENSPFENKVLKGPPAPRLPELNQLKSKIPEDDEGSLGGEDLFKNIK
jgi:hypothetical protein